MLICRGAEELNELEGKNIIQGEVKWFLAKYIQI